MCECLIHNAREQHKCRIHDACYLLCTTFHHLILKKLVVSWIYNLCKRCRSMQKMQIYAKYTNLCKRRQSMQNTPIYAKDADLCKRGRFM